ncbi:MAG: CAP domain-containing protein, partial [Acidobacteriota bacterium]
YRPRILVQYPGGRTLRMKPARRGAEWFTVVPVGQKIGTLILQILAENEVGPGVVAVMPLRIGAVTAEPDNIDQTPAGNQLEITGPWDAAFFLLETVNAERSDHGLDRLKWDERLADLATQHSQDMRENDFFGHRSPSHGDLRQRLTAASYSASVSRENLALDQDLMSAHLSLMASPGHRSNILASDVTHIGIGVVRQVSSEGPPHWIITEIFTRQDPNLQKPDEPR